jgi:uncharacterized protein YecE (DUF72 family)
MGTSEEQANGYAAADIKRWADRAARWRAGGQPHDIETLGAPAEHRTRDVFLYVISGFKPRNPQAAMALIAAADEFAHA